MMKHSLICLLLILSSAPAFADDIEFPEEELARETTLPVFDKRRAVLNRNVITTERFEFGLGGGIEMNEPFYNDYMFGLQGTYNFTDVHALNVQGLMWMDGLSNYGDQLKAGTKITGAGGGTVYFDAEKAPHPKWAIFGNYQFLAYYGKISLSKQSVMNLNLFALAGLGYINMDSVGVPAINLGLGQNFFFTNNFGVRADLRWLIYQGPDATSQDLSPNRNPSASSFDSRIFYIGQMGLSLVFLL